MDSVLPWQFFDFRRYDKEGNRGYGYRPSNLEEGSQSVTKKYAEKHADFFTEFHKEVRGKACGLFHRVSQRKRMGLL
ncbi:MAG: hypothetical protein PHN88_01735 [Ignavibacteria bacterium]|nr:hypothetical protein [Ignavibacteria bacterium]